MKNVLGWLLAAALMLVVVYAVINTETKPADETSHNTVQFSASERQKMDLYITVMTAAFEEENGGSGFIAVHLDSLEGLSDAAKTQVLKELTVLSPQVYNFEDVKDDTTKFEFYDAEHHSQTLDGTVLWVKVEEYSATRAVITGVSWFGALGAVFPKYEAIYENGSWQLKLISMAVS
jgi:ABC-type glycerol-3-phosphate transport system substrate-binding protein